MITKICKLCEKEYQVAKPSDAKRRVFCSKSCLSISCNRSRKKIPEKKTCVYCDSVYWAATKRQKNKKYCSVGCMMRYRNKHINPRIISEKYSGENSPYWMGESAGYWAKHMWIRNLKGSANGCSCCLGKNSNYYEWANISREYKRDVSDWIQLCRSCHKAFDLNKWTLQKLFSVRARL